jgi:hypothetical protein
MESVIEFPKLKTPEEAPEATSPVGSKKIANIADWTPRSAVQFNIGTVDGTVDNWPFCAA